MHSKRRQKKYREDPPDVRSRKFESERKKYSLLPAKIISDANLPVVSLVQTLDDPAASWIHIFAARRGNTLKNRYKVWKPFQQWLEVHRGILYPRGVKDAIDYLQHRVNEGCGRTVPDSFNATLSMIEQVGRVVEGERISDDPLWRGHIKSWGAELAADAPPKKPAEMYTVAIVLALELTVMDDTAPVFQRALAWVLNMSGLPSGCFRIQKAVNRCLVEGKDEAYFEDEAIQRLCDAAESSGANPNRIRKRHSPMSMWTGRHCLGGVYPTLEILEDDWQEPEDIDESDASLLGAVAAITEKGTSSKPQESKYFITISRRTCLRRLHLNGCFVKPDRCCEVLFTDSVSSDEFDTICQACKKKMLAECGRDDADLSGSSTASSSSTASEAEDVEDSGNVPMG
eukprot:s5258_g2.t1